MNVHSIIASLSTEQAVNGFRANSAGGGNAVSAAGMFPVSLNGKEDFSFTLNQLLMNAAGDHAPEEEIDALLAQLDALLSQLMQTEEWTDAEWDVLSMASVMLNQLFQSVQSDPSIITTWLQNNSNTLETLAQRLSDQQFARMNASVESNGQTTHVKNDLLKEIDSSLPQRLQDQIALKADEASQGRTVVLQQTNISQLVESFEKLMTEAAKMHSDHTAERQVRLQSLEQFINRLVEIAGQQLRPQTELAASIRSLSSVQNELKAAIDFPSVSVSVRNPLEGQSLKTTLEHQYTDVQTMVMREGSSLQEQQLQKNTQNTPVQPIETDFTQPVAVKDLPRQELSQVNAARPAAAIFTAQAHQFNETISQVLLQKWQTSQLDGVSEARIKLFPEHLGHLDITIKLHNGQMVAQFIADSMTGKEMIESQLFQLRTSLQNQGIQVDKLEVLHQSDHQLQQEHHRQQQQSENQLKKHVIRSSGYEVTHDEWYDDRSAAGEMQPLLHGGVFDASI